MKILLDTNILIHRERSNVTREDIGILFQWFDKLGATKCIHPASAEELAKHADPKVVKSMMVKIKSYRQLRTRAEDTPEIAELRKHDFTKNAQIDTDLLAELAARRVEFIVTEDRGIHRKASAVGLKELVFTIDSFLEKANSENPELVDYGVLSVRKAYFGNINLEDPFFDSFRRDYEGFDNWFNRKADDEAYICESEGGSVAAFLYLKREGPEENYYDISPAFAPKQRLKIGTFKVIANGFKLGERFLKIIFDNAIQYSVDEIYVTVFQSSDEHERLISMLKEWGFEEYGEKVTPTGTEVVLCRTMNPDFNNSNPRKTYPFVTRSTRQFIVPIYPAYHTELLPDSILTTESAHNFVDNKPNRNAVSKVYISRSIERDILPGDSIVFYRTRTGQGSAHFTSVATTIGVVQEVFDDIPDLETFLRLCRKRSVFTDDELKAHWDYNPRSRPFIVNFLQVHSLPRRPNLSTLKNEGIIEEAPRGFELLTQEAFDRLLEISNANERLVVD